MARAAGFRLDLDLDLLEAEVEKLVPGGRQG